MAHAIRLGTPTEWLDLCDGSRYLLRGIESPPPAAGERNRVVAGPLDIVGATADELWDNRRAIERMLLRARTARRNRDRANRVALSVMLETGTWSHFDVLDGSLGTFEHMLTADYVTTTLTLTCLPEVRGESLTLQNLLTAPADATAAAWTATNLTATADDATAPDGSDTADTLLETTATGAHSMTQTVTKDASSTQYTWSAFVKPSGRSSVHLSMLSGANGATAGYTLSGAGSVSSAAAAVGSGWTGVSAAITAADDGWYRVSLTATSDGAASMDVVLALSDGSSTSYAGNASLGVAVWGMQLEEAAEAGLLVVPQMHPDTVRDEYTVAEYLIPEVPAVADLDPDNLLATESWQDVDYTLTASQSDPTGGTGAVLATEEAVTGSNRRLNTASSANTGSSGTATGAVFLKKGPNGPSTVWVRVAISTNRGYAVPVNLDTGAVGTPIAASDVSGYTSPTGSTIDFGDGWWWVKWTGTIPASSSHELYVHTNSNFETSHTGDTNRAVYVWRPQIVTGSTIDEPTPIDPEELVPEEVVPAETVAAGKLCGAYVYGIPGDAPALLRVELDDDSTDVVVNRVHIGGWSGQEVRYGDVVPLWQLVAGEGATDVSDGTNYSGTSYASAEVTPLWAPVGAVTMPDGAPRGMVDVWARVRSRSETISPPARVTARVTGGIYPRRILRHEVKGRITSLDLGTPAIQTGKPLILLLEYQGFSLSAGGIPTVTMTGDGGLTWTQLVTPYTADTFRFYAWYVEAADVTDQLSGPLQFSWGGAEASMVGVTLLDIVGAASTGMVTDTDTATLGGRGDTPNTTSPFVSVTTTQAHSMLLSWGIGTMNFWPLTGVFAETDWRSVSSLSTGAVAYKTYTALVTETLQWYRLPKLGPGGIVQQPEPEGWIVGLVAIKAAEASAATLTVANWNVVVTALDANGTESLPIGGAVYVPSTSSALTVSWDEPLVGTPVEYRVYRNTGSGWGYMTVAAPATEYQWTNESSVTSGSPPTANPAMASVRATVALESGTTVWETAPVSIEHANSVWEDVKLGTLPLPPTLDGEADTPSGWRLGVEAAHPDGDTVDVDGVWLYEAGTGQAIAYRDGLEAETPLGWVVETQRDEGTIGWLRDAAGDEAGQLAFESPGALRIQPGNALIIIRPEVAGAESDIVNADLSLRRLVITPRWRYVRGSEGV